MSSTLSNDTNDADGTTPGNNGILIPTHIDNIPIKYDGNPASIPAVLHELELWTLRTGTDDNIADLPSRGDFDLVRILGGDVAFKEAVVPPLSSLVGPLASLVA